MTEVQPLPPAAEAGEPTLQTYVRPAREPIEHELKTWQSYFHAIADGSKTFELRRDDRDFRVGDTLRLRETEYATGAYTGREVRTVITQILRHEPDLGLMDGFAILSMRRAHPIPGAGEGRAVAETFDGATDAALTRENETLILGQQDGRCFYCARIFKRQDTASVDTRDGYRGVIFDHLIPRRVGGSHGPENRVAACSKCDGSKGGRLPTLEEMHKKGEQFLRAARLKRHKDCTYPNCQCPTWGPARNGDRVCLPANGGKGLPPLSQQHVSHSPPPAPAPVEPRFDEFTNERAQIPEGYSAPLDTRHTSELIAERLAPPPATGEVGAQDQPAVRALTELAVARDERNAWRERAEALTTSLDQARAVALRDAAHCQPATCLDPTSTAFDRGYFDGVMTYRRAIDALRNIPAAPPSERGRTP